MIAARLQLSQARIGCNIGAGLLLCIIHPSRQPIKAERGHPTHLLVPVMVAMAGVAFGLGGFLGVLLDFGGLRYRAKRAG
jgi:hypothetical protein